MKNTRQEHHNELKRMQNLCRNILDSDNENLTVYSPESAFDFHTDLHMPQCCLESLGHKHGFELKSGLIWQSTTRFECLWCNSYLFIVFNVLLNGT